MSQTKEQILKTASKTFGRYGFYKTSMDEIAKSARKAKGSLYYHFNSKELLFEEVVGLELKILKEELTSIFELKNIDSRDILKEYMLTRMKILRNSPNYLETIRPEFYEYYEFLNDLKTEMDSWEKQQLTLMLEKGLASDVLELPSDVKVYGEVIVMMLKGLESPFFLKGEYDRLELNFDNLINVITKGISK